MIQNTVKMQVAVNEYSTLNFPVYLWIALIYGTLDVSACCIVALNRFAATSKIFFNPENCRE